jgi:hypothetical protein
VTAAGGLFFPQSKSLGIDAGETSPALLAKITYAGTASRSFAEGSALLDQLADLAVPEKQVERVTRRIGAERVAEREADVAAFAALPLVEKFAVPGGVTAPPLAVVMADGGRLQIRDAWGADPASPEPATAPGTVVGETAAVAEDWEEENAAAARAGHWREDKVGLLLTMTSAVATADPCPEIPASFLDVVRIPKLVRELHQHVQEGEDAVTDAGDPEAAAAALQAEATYRPPVVQQRQVVASRQTWPLFALLLAQAAWALGFQGATRKAFVGDGSANNWKVQRRFFGSFVPILDFIHALSYVFAAALAGRRFAAGWAVYQQWIRRLWQGQVAEIIAALEVRQAELGLPHQDEPETSPRRVVAKTLTYLGNHQDKMRYDVYRRQGLPITSSHVESVVKQINQRVKGTEKFWSEDGSEAVLQLRADYLSDGEPLDAFWERRQAAATGQRRYRRVG